MRRVNINLSSVEYDRAAGDFKRVWPVVSQLVNAEVGTTLVCPLALSSRCSDLRERRFSPRLSFAVIRVLFLPSLYSAFSLSYVIHRLGGKDLHADVEPEALSALLASR